MVVLVNCGEAAVSGAVVGHPGQNKLRRAPLPCSPFSLSDAGGGATAAGEYAGADSNSGGEAKVLMQVQVQIQIRDVKVDRSC